MKHYRYGKLRFRDYMISWFSIAILLVFAAASIVLDLSPVFIIFPVIYAAVWLLAILVPHCEQFILCNDSITVLRGRKAHTINLPPKLTLVVSYADICPPMATLTQFGKQTHILKDKYAISILQKTSLDIALKTLQRNHVQKYTTSRIQTIFNDYHYIYSFVCNQSLVEELITNKQITLIVPESILEVIPIDLKIVNIENKGQFFILKDRGRFEGQGDGSIVPSESE